MTRDEFIREHPLVPLPSPNGIFTCQHEERGFVSKRGKTNRTHARWKRRNKARIKARKAK